MVSGFDNIGVCVTDLKTSVAFYEMLGLREVYRNERGVLMSAGNAQLFLFATRQVHSPPVGRKLGLFENAPGIDHISFAVADVDAAYVSLIKTGVEFDGEPQDQSWGARMVGLRDPDGNNLYLLQKL
jgi:catechol 2,3-dioxygenase-like lactoylglutathione lyase family enzyme